jgi:hypothetical protein
VCDCIELIEKKEFRVTVRVEERIAAAKAREVEKAKLLEETARAAREAAKIESLEETRVQSDSDEDVDIPGESEQIRALKTRRRELKALLNAHRPEIQSLVTGKKSKKEKEIHQKALKPGYTVSPNMWLV